MYGTALFAYATKERTVRYMEERERRWQVFCQTGKVEDYLRYAALRKEGKQDAPDDRRTGDPRKQQYR